MTDDLMHRCAADGRGITWLTRNGRFLARVGGPHSGNPHLRIQQFRAHGDPDRQLGLAQSMVAGKLHNYRQLLLRSARDLPAERQSVVREVAEQHAVALNALSTVTTMDQARGIEGSAARAYFQALPAVAPSVGAGRHRRPPTDVFNCLLSFGYGMLRTAVHGAIEQVGLDPYLGYLHGIRPAKPALALDLMEEFRPLLVDRLVLTQLNRSQIKPSHTETLPTGQVQLTDDGRKFFLEQWSSSRERSWPHAYLDREVPAGLLPLIQARILARHLRGDTRTYIPWTVS
ncbi:type I-C CRISPR-associated endonuclease Cas1c [Nocardia goodfellowii]|uniref:CRISPR-associated endonuclease Cas1 n=1 Tax=Nocardia goodfellowii TaxID=882446 RepID=A0ABS4QJ76_9NOCA|nr:CRISPR-associated protein Cas1 [Nocardia goodfellowii]